MNPHLLSDADVHLFQQGPHCRLQEKLGAHPVTVKGVSVNWHYQPYSLRLTWPPLSLLFLEPGWHRLALMDLTAIPDKGNPQ